MILGSIELFYKFLVEKSMAFTNSDIPIKGICFITLS